MSGPFAFQTKARTAESYLAGIGASGALMGSAFVLFVVLVGVVTFNAWPHAGELIPGTGNASLEAAGLTGQAPSEPAPAPNLVTLLGGPAPAGTPPVSDRGGRGGGGSIHPGGGIGFDGGGGSPGGGGGGGGNGGGGGGSSQPTTIVPSTPSVSSTTQRDTGVVGQVLQGVGNNVEGDTNRLGETLGGSDNSLGGVVQGLGGTLNVTLQRLGGTR